MASNVDLCGVCATLGQSVPSTAWCVNCDEALCVNCKTQHTASKGTNSHQLTPIEIYRQLPSDVLKISQTCLEHQERYLTYCGEHQCACCLKCTLSKHKGCKDMLSIDDVVGDVKISNALTECEANLEENKENVAMFIKDRKQNLSFLQKEKIKIQAKIRETRRNINEHLDKIEAQILNELTKLEEMHTSKIQELVALLEQKEHEIKEMQGSLKALKEYASDLQIFLSMKRTEKLTSSDNEYLQSICSSGDLNNISLCVELDKTLKDIEKIIPTFGRVVTSLDPCSIVLKKSKDKQAQLHIPNVRSIDSIRLDLIKSIDVKKIGLFGCRFLPDGRFAVRSNDYKSECIVVMKDNGIVDCQIDVKYWIFDITHIPSTNSLAVTTGPGDKTFINIVNIDSRKVVRSIPTDTYNFGITYKDGDMFYCAEDVGICKMNIDTGKVTTIMNIPGMSPFSYITTYQDKLYYTNRGAHTVTCCSIDGTKKWEYRDKEVVRYPFGICVDTHGYVYVVGEETNNLIVISPDGDRHSELLTEEDGLKSPRAVDYDRNSNRVLVTNLNGKVFLYKVK